MAIVKLVLKWMGYLNEKFVSRSIMGNFMIINKEHAIRPSSAAATEYTLSPIGKQFSHKREEIGPDLPCPVPC